MTRFVSLFFFALALVSSQVALGAPSCSHGMENVDACVSKCKNKFGWPGFAMGNDRWGSVAYPSAEDTSNRVTKACGGPKNQTSTEPAGSSPPVATSPPSYVSPTPISGPFKLSSKSSLTVTSSTHTTSKTSSLPPSSPPPNLNGDVHEPTKGSSTSSPPPSPTPTPTTTHSQPPPPPPTTSSTPPSSTPNSSGTVSSDDISAYLSAHNTVRAQHGANPLTWSDELSAKAQQWADGCHFVHSGGTLGQFGENLAAGTGSGYTIATAVKSWTDEVSDYDPSNPVASHFTQVVWKASTQVGCAVKDCNGIFDPKFGIAHFHVCEYSPPGNVEGEYADNVQV
ncbi:CAP domain-containing protein [Lactarius hengduanensis]|nr:CAP domain-containing protein [Lactarius hengduanensis]